MADFRKVSPGQPLSKAPSRSASWLNAVSAAAQAYQETSGPGGSSAIRSQQNPVEVKVKNITGGDLLRGHAVLLDESLLDEVNHRKPFVSGVTPADGKTRPLALLKSACKNNKFTEAFVAGVAPAIVDVASLDDTHASVEDGSNVLVSGTSGQVEILTPPTTTGEQELLVLLGGGGGGSGGASISGLLGLVITDIPKASDFDFSGEVESIPAFDWELDVGLKLSGGEEDPTVWQLDWKRTNATIETYETSPYEQPFRKLRPVVVEEDGNYFVKSYPGINLAKTDIRASKAEPIVVTGFRYRLLIDEVAHEWFIITNVMDMRAIPNFIKGTTPAGADDPNLQIIHHKGGENSFTMDSDDCAGEG